MAKAPGCLQAGWTAGGCTAPSTRCTPTFLSSPTLPFYTSFSVIPWVTLPVSAWGPAPNKASNQGKVQGPQKCSQIKHRGVENQTNGPHPLESTFGMLGAGEGCPGGCRAPQGFWQEEPWDRPSDRGAGAAPRNKLRGDQRVHRQDPANSPKLNSC